MEPCGTLQFRSPESEQSFSKVTIKDLFDKYDLNHKIAEFVKTR